MNLPKFTLTDNEGWAQTTKISELLSCGIFAPLRKWNNLIQTKFGV